MEEPLSPTVGAMLGAICVVVILASIFFFVKAVG